MSEAVFMQSIRFLRTALLLALVSVSMSSHSLKMAISMVVRPF